MKKIVVIFIMMLYSVGNYCFSQTAGGFLEIPIGAEAQGVGNAFTSRISPISTYWNPSAISYLGGPSILLQYTQLSLDVKHNFINYIYPSPKFAIGASLINSEVGGIEIRSAGNFTLIPEAIIKSEENAYIISIAKKMDNKFKVRNNINIDDDISVGINYKYISQDVYSGSARGNSFDMGVLYREKDGLSLGVMFQDIGGKIKWNTGKKYNIPLNVKFGVSKKFLEDRLITSFDIGKRKYNSTKYFFGSEYSINNIVKLQCGLDAGRFTVGVGFNLSNLQINYSYKKENLFGDTQRFTITHKLWKEKLPIKVEAEHVETKIGVNVEAETKPSVEEKSVEEKVEITKDENLTEEITELTKIEAEAKPQDEEPEVKIETKPEEQEEVKKPLVEEKAETIQVQPTIVKEIKPLVKFAIYIMSVEDDIVKFYTGEYYKIGDTLLIRTEKGEVVGKCEVINIAGEISVGKIISQTEKIRPFSYYVVNY